MIVPQRGTEAHRVHGGHQLLHLLTQRARHGPIQVPSDRFYSTLEVQKALDQLKTFLTTPAVLVSPMIDEPLLLYIAAMT